jgi:hypothetical protein
LAGKALISIVIKEIYPISNKIADNQKYIAAVPDFISTLKNYSLKTLKEV